MLSGSGGAPGRGGFVNRRTALDVVRGNFLLVVFDVEGLYGECLLPIVSGSDARQYYGDGKRKRIRKLMSDYDLYARTNGIEPSFPRSAMDFQLNFFSFARASALSTRAALLELVDDAALVGRFMDGLERSFKRPVENLSCSASSAYGLLSEILDAFYLKVMAVV